MKPFVKWAGGKSRLLYEIERRLPADFHEWEDVTYVEPFVGSGSVLFHMLKLHPNITHAVINDINKVLMASYEAIRDNPDEVYGSLELLENEYNSLKSISAKSNFYYLCRDHFNGYKESLSRFSVTLFIFLNHTCFNGLYRENARGLFNVPHGKYEKIRICDRANLTQLSQVLQKVDIRCGDFSGMLSDMIHESDQPGKHFIYADPPYRPINRKASMFTQYDKSGFGDEDQSKLKEFCDILARSGAQIMISNSDSYVDEGSYFENLYQGYNIDRIEVTRMINPYNSKNRRPKEVIITSYPIPQFNNPQLPLL